MSGEDALIRSATIFGSSTRAARVLAQFSSCVAVTHRIDQTAPFCKKSQNAFGSRSPIRLSLSDFQASWMARRFSPTRPRPQRAFKGDRLRRLLQPLAFRKKSVIRTPLNNYSPRPRRQRRSQRGVVEFAADSPLEVAGGGSHERLLP